MSTPVVVTLMKGSFATRLKDPSFMTAFNALLDRFASEQVVVSEPWRPDWMIIAASGRSDNWYRSSASLVKP